MAVDDQLRLCPRNIRVQSVKTVVHLILPIVNSPWGIVRQEDVDRWEGRKETVNFPLVIQKMPARFVFPRTVQATKTETVDLSGLEVQIGNEFPEGRIAVVISFDGKDGLAAVGLRGFENDLVRHVATRQQDVGLPRPVLPVEIVNVGYGQDSHLISNVKLRCAALVASL